MANAGMNSLDPVYHMDDPSEDPKEPAVTIVQVGLIGVLYTTKLAFHYFGNDAESNKRDRSLIITSSAAGYVDQPGSPQYSAIKWGVRGIMRSLRRTSLRENIRVNILAPWYMVTPMHTEATKAHFKKVGAEEVLVEDSRNAIGRIIVDTSINGRGVGLVPRSLSPTGYLDLDLDDYKGHNIGTIWQDWMLKASHRINVPVDGQLRK